MSEFFSNNWETILLGLVSAALAAFCRYCWKRIKEYKKLLDEKVSEKQEVAIEEKLAPIEDEIEELRAYIRNLDEEDKRKFNLIISSYRFRLVQLCRLYLTQGYMTEAQFEQLNEFYNLYYSLGGNGQAKEYYERVIKLPIHD